VDAVINVAGLYNELTEQYDSGANCQMNTHATASLAFLCKGSGIKRFLFASSCAVYHPDGAQKNPDAVFDEESAVSPGAGYGRAKFEAEKLLLGMADDNFCPVILRKGTLFGFSPRMRYDLLVNTFLRDALARGRMDLRCGGEMWRPMLEVRDAAKAYIACLEAPEAAVRGQVFNVAQGNYRVSELALHVRQALRGSGESAEIGLVAGRREECSYRVSCEKIKRVLGFVAALTVEESVAHMLLEVRAAHFTDFENARYCNLKWIQQLLEAEKIISLTGAVFSADRNAPKNANCRNNEMHAGPGSAAGAKRLELAAKG
jgi:nucleoside-diphosphate-sugar epimerase